MNVSTSTADYMCSPEREEVTDQYHIPLTTLYGNLKSLLATLKIVHCNTGLEGGGREGEGKREGKREGGRERERGREGAREVTYTEWGTWNEASILAGDYGTCTSTCTSVSSLTSTQAAMYRSPSIMQSWHTPSCAETCSIDTGFHTGFFFWGVS